VSIQQRTPKRNLIFISSNLRHGILHRVVHIENDVWIRFVVAHVSAHNRQLLSSQLEPSEFLVDSISLGDKHRILCHSTTRIMDRLERRRRCHLRFLPNREIQTNHFGVGHLDSKNLADGHVRIGTRYHRHIHRSFNKIRDIFHRIKQLPSDSRERQRMIDRSPNQSTGNNVAASAVDQFSPLRPIDTWAASKAL